MAQKALEMWVQDGRHLNPGDKAQTRPNSSSTATAIVPGKPAPRVASGSFQLSSEIKISDDSRLDFEGDGHDSHDDKRALS